MSQHQQHQQQRKKSGNHSNVGSAIRIGGERGVGNRLPRNLSSKQEIRSTTNVNPASAIATSSDAVDGDASGDVLAAHAAMLQQQQQQQQHLHPGGVGNGVGGSGGGDLLPRITGTKSQASTASSSATRDSGISISGKVTYSSNSLEYNIPTIHSHATYLHMIF